jgi:hypothetical protein
MKVKPNFF